MKISKAEGRDKKRDKKKYGMRVKGRSIFTIVETQVRRAKKKKRKKRRKSTLDR